MKCDSYCGKENNKIGNYRQIVLRKNKIVKYKSQDGE